MMISLPPGLCLTVSMKVWMSSRPRPETLPRLLGSVGSGRVLGSKPLPSSRTVKTSPWRVEPAQEALLLLLGLGGSEHLLEGFGQVAGQALLGDVAGRTFLQRLNGDVLAAVGRHQDDGHQRVAGADGLDQLQAVHLGHEHV